MLEEVKWHLTTMGIGITTGTIVDTKTIHTDSTTKKQASKFESEMHHTKKNIGGT